MEQLFTWAMLGTYAGASVAVALITQLIKDYIPIATQLLSYFVAVLVLLVAEVFGGTLTAASGVLCIFNGLVVGLAANGEFAAVKKLFSGIHSNGSDSGGTT